jgi:uncharacterized caspase-like protein
MANYSLIAIGINNYQFLQPLSYAQEDAEILHQFLVSELEIPLEQTLLLTDFSATGDRSTYPNREGIISCFNQLSSRSPLPQGQTLWFFFSGYGVHHGGEDYLLPIDAQLGDIPKTGISMRSLFQTLKAYSPHQTVVFLDFNRSPGLIRGGSVGLKTLDLAQEMGIALIISTQGEQLSHESADLGHGLFTSALLEALRYYQRELTLNSLSRYLGDRLPELSQHHWRPVQNPAIFIPSQLQGSILPSKLPSAEELQTIPINNGHFNGVNGASGAAGAAGAAGAGVIQITVNQNNPNQIPIQAPVTVPDVPQPISQPISQPTPQPSQPGNIISNLSNKNMGNGSVPDIEPVKPEVDLTEKTSESKPHPTKNPLYWGVLAGAATGATIVGLSNLNQNPNIPQPNGDSTATVSPSPTTTVSPSPTTTVSPSPTATVSPSPTATPSANTPTLSQGEVALSKATSHLRNHQATDFSKAIEEALKVPQGDPAYNQARNEISRWSWVILDIAIGRSIQGNLTGAIAAAKLVPQQEKVVYDVAQNKIKLWESQKEQELLNRILIQEIQKQILPNQASSYNRAITALRKIRPGEPHYERAQQLKEEWSRRIYLIANSRAANGNFTLAVQAAQLVPQDSNSYQQAQQAIARWKQGKR